MVRVTFCVALVEPTGTLPKLGNVAGDAATGVVPVPVNETDWFPNGITVPPLVVMVSPMINVPVCAPVLRGRKATPMLHLVPAGTELAQGG